MKRTHESFKGSDWVEIVKAQQRVRGARLRKKQKEAHKQAIENLMAKNGWLEEDKT